MICKWQRKVECFSMISVTSSVNKKTFSLNVAIFRMYIQAIHLFAMSAPPLISSVSFFLFFTIKCDFLVVLALNRTEYDYKDIQCERRSSPFMFKSTINHIRISRCRQHLPTYISMYKRSVHYKWCK